jgi:hypothetical protein
LAKKKDVRLLTLTARDSGMPAYMGPLVQGLHGLGIWASQRSVESSRNLLVEESAVQTVERMAAPLNLKVVSNIPKGGK